MNKKGFLKVLAGIAGGYVAGRIHGGSQTELLRRQLDFEHMINSLSGGSQNDKEVTGLSFLMAVEPDEAFRDIPADFDDKTRALAASISEVSPEDGKAFTTWMELVKGTYLMKYFYDFMSHRSPAEIVSYLNTLPKGEPGYWQFMRDLGIPGVDDFRQRIAEIETEYPGKYGQAVKLGRGVINTTDYNLSQENYQKFMGFLGELSMDEAGRLFDSFERDCEINQPAAENKLLRSLLLGSVSDMKQHFRNIGWI